MTLKRSRFGYWELREWTCCGYLWQALMSRKYPERYSWSPQCPRCGHST